jgi:hypothetical protein
VRDVVRSSGWLPDDRLQGDPVDGAYHDVDSSVMAFEIAARAALPRSEVRRLKMKLLEPIMKVEVVTPDEYTGSVIGDLNSRRGQIRDQEMRGNATVVNAFVPLANMFGYVNNLRSATQGRAQLHHAVRPLRAGAASCRRRSDLRNTPNLDRHDPLKRRLSEE